MCDGKHDVMSIREIFCTHSCYFSEAHCLKDVQRNRIQHNCNFISTNAIKLRHSSYTDDGHGAHKTEAKCCNENH